MNHIVEGGLSDLALSVSALTVSGVVITGDAGERILPWFPSWDFSHVAAADRPTIQFSDLSVGTVVQNVVTLSGRTGISFPASCENGVSGSIDLPVSLHSLVPSSGSFTLTGFDTGTPSSVGLIGSGRMVADKIALALFFTGGNPTVGQVVSTECTWSCQFSFL
jgi:hypothetical protein